MLRRTFILAAAMSSAAYAAHTMRPNRLLADVSPPLDLAREVPLKFANWRIDDAASVLVVDPVTEAALNSIYSQIVSRTYLAEDGASVMLSIAYGKNQSDNNSLHYPDVCYPAQGFDISGKSTEKLHVSGRVVPVKKMIARKGGRVEPITYWVTIGDQIVLNPREQKIKQLTYGLKGLIPDGMLFRVSNIAPDGQPSWVVQEDFVRKLADALPPQTFSRIFGA